MVAPARMRSVFLGACLLFLFLTGCRQPTASAPDSLKGEIKTAIQSYLASRPNLSLENMTIEVKDVKVTGDTADAEVLFRPKSGEGEMPFAYRLRRENGRWVVQHGDAETTPGGLPTAHPPTDRGDPAPAH